MELEAKRALFSHLPEEVLEKYAFGRLPADELAAFETHLLHCEKCQERLAEQDNFAEAMRVLELLNESPTLELARGRLAAEIAPAKPAAPERFHVFGKPFAPPVPNWNNPVWGAALLSVLVMGICAWRMPIGWFLADNEPQAVTLTTLRGGSTDSVAEARVGHPLDLSMNIADLANSPAEAGPYRIEVVDAAGDPRWTGKASLTLAGQIKTHVQKSLKTGSYWVRLYAPSGKLIREFGLHVS